MKIKYLLSVSDYKKSSIEFLKKRYFFGLISYFILSLLTSYAIVYKDFDLVHFLWIIIYHFFFFLIIFMIIPDLIKKYRIQETIKNQPYIFESKYLEIKENGIELTNTENSKINCFEWNTIKKISETKNYNFIVLKNKTSIILKKEDAEKTEFIEKIKSKLTEQYIT